jgi:hypothetical protein
MVIFFITSPILTPGEGHLLSNPLNKNYRKMNPEYLIGGSLIATAVVGIIGLVVIVTWVALPFIVWAKLSSIDYHVRSIHGMLNVVLNMGAGVTVSTKKPQSPFAAQGPCSDAG